MAIGNVVYPTKKPLTREDVVNNLLSNASNLPLSALQGKKLDETIQNLFNANIHTITDDADNCVTGISAVEGNAKNSPYSFWSTVIQTEGATERYKQQLAIPWARGEEKSIKTRICDAGSWGEWIEFISASHFKYEASEFLTFIMAPAKEGALQSNIITLPNAVNKTIQLDYIGVPATEQFNADDFTISKNRFGFWLSTSNVEIVNKYQGRCFIATFIIN